MSPSRRQGFAGAAQVKALRAVATAILWRTLPLVAAGDAETDTLTNGVPIVVEATRLRHATWTADGWDGAALFDELPQVSLRQQGTHGAQRDVSVRGGSFQTSGVLLQGIGLQNPQTEHFQGDLDLPGDYLTAAAVVTGIDRFARSSAHASGAIAADLAPLETTGRLAVGIGPRQRRGLLQQGVAPGVPGSGVPGVAFFVGADAAERTDGLPDNSLRRQRFGGRAQWLLADESAIDLLVASASRAFGARGFYGTPRTVPSEEEVTQTLLLASYGRGNRADRDFDRLSTALTRMHDTYWYTGKAGGSPSRHRSTVLALHAERARPYGESLTLHLRGDWTSEWLRSRTLGNCARARLALAALPTWTLGTVALTAGGAFEGFDDDRPGWLPALGIEVHASERHTLFINYSEALRQPSYTEYQYNNPTSLGNSGLKRQQTRTTEAGWRGTWPEVEASLTGFAEHASDAVDWQLRERGDTRYQAVNLDDVWRWGITYTCDIELGRRHALRLSGLFQEQHSDTPYYASRYLMDYVRHDLRTEWIWRAAPGWEARLWQRIQKMNDNPLRHGSDRRWLIGAEVHWQSSRVPGLTWTAGVANLLNGDFEVFVGQPEAGRQCYLLAEYRW